MFNHLPFCLCKLHKFFMHLSCIFNFLKIKKKKKAYAANVAYFHQFLMLESMNKIFNLIKKIFFLNSYQY